LKNIIKQSPDAFGVFDNKNRLTYTNQRFVDIFGISIDNAIGLTHTELLKNAFDTKPLRGIFIESDDFDSWVAGIELRLRNHKLKMFESDMADGRWLKVSQLTLEDDNLIIFATDITKQKKTEQKLNEALMQVELLASIDSLTGIFNRRFFMESCKSELASCHRHKRPVAMIVMDIDDFKLVNDTYGHPVGDIVLIEFAKIINKELRESDIFGRIGGEEFGIMISDKETERAFDIADRLRNIISKKEIMIDVRNKTINITASFGVTMSKSIQTTVSSLLKDADEAMYKSKRNGRNCCVLK
jgi:diguanylate cyclase (GGDEF)-like protein/PAS domain S-box-containing protein